MKYNVTKNIMIFRYTQVDAGSEEEAIEIAKELDEDYWEENPNDAYMLDWNYDAERDE